MYLRVFSRYFIEIFAPAIYIYIITILEMIVYEYVREKRIEIFVS